MHAVCALIPPPPPLRVNVAVSPAFHSSMFPLGCGLFHSLFRSSFYTAIGNEVAVMWRPDRSALTDNSDMSDIPSPSRRRLAAAHATIDGGGGGVQLLCFEQWVRPTAPPAMDLAHMLAVFAVITALLVVFFALALPETNSTS